MLFKKVLLATFLAISFMTNMTLHAQEEIDTLRMVKKNGNVFMKDGEILKLPEVMMLMENNREAYKEMKLAVSNFNGAMVLSYAGGFCIGWPLGTAIAGGKPLWGMMVAGGVLIAITIPLASAYGHHAREAVRIYNQGLKEPAITQVRFNFGTTHDGIGFVMRF